MNVGQLKKELEKYPDTMDVFLADRKTEFAYGLVNSVWTQEITFAENPDWGDEEPYATDTVVVIDEE